MDVSFNNREVEMFPLIPLLMNAVPSLVEAFTGKMAGHKVEKGLFRSKTARDATFALGAKLVGVFILPLPAWLQWTVAAAVFVEWGAQLYRRVRTSEPVV